MKSGTHRRSIIQTRLHKSESPADEGPDESGTKRESLEEINSGWGVDKEKSSEIIFSELFGTSGDIELYHRGIN